MVFNRLYYLNGKTTSAGTEDILCYRNVGKTQNVLTFQIGETLLQSFDGVDLSGTQTFPGLKRESKIDRHDEYCASPSQSKSYTFIELTS
jgi:hypothetical protein